MCNACFRNDKIKILTTLAVEHKSCLTVIRNIPCLECLICGDAFFSDEVSEHLEKIIKEDESGLREVSIIDYSKKKCRFS